MYNFFHLATTSQVLDMYACIRIIYNYTRIKYIIYNLYLYNNTWTVYNITSWIPGFARDPLSRSLSPSLSRPSLPSLLSVPAFYPPSLGLPGFAQDNCIPEILFKPWCLVTLTFSPLSPPPSDGVGWGLHVLVIFSAEFFYLSIFSAVREISRTFEILTPNPHPGTLDPPGWGG